MQINHEFYMQLALDEAWKYQLLTYPNPAVGAVVIKNGEILSIEAHHEAGKPHAEVNALKAAYIKYYPNSQLSSIEDSFEIHEYLKQNHNDFFHDCIIYVTLEPCNHTGKTPACSMLISALGIKEVFIGAMDPNKEASGGYDHLLNANISVETGILKKKCEELLYPFTQWQQKPFMLFKLAQRIDGSIGGGKISSQNSLNWVHKLRTKIDTLLIGGNTVREDRPTLDARYVDGKAPNIVIYSRKKEFDQTISLFNVPNRKIVIKKDLDILHKSKFVLIEGGYNFLALLEQKIDMVVIILSAKTYKSINQSLISIEYEILYQYFNQEDIIIYLKIKKSE